MKEKKYHNHNKVYVKVEALFHPDGRLIPVALWWEDGCRYPVDRVIDICRAASLKAGGIGIRYACTVLGRQVYLFYEEDRWFMERREA
ncbi:MAG: hypothetical protein KGZ54_03900 [Dethiobacter sp.]|jgi:hypothetical protein|nr:hypothetical protein [Dethiobacter sp.]MBS3901144.1 hypothetical protein [Dethiobacter sp.]MBS3989064.1 hypothetical protein [Dethiobacter sp.]